MTTALEGAMRRLEVIASGGRVAINDDPEASLEGDIATVLAALSTPPADDVREALAECIHAGLRRDDWGVANEDEREEPLAAADAILADPRFDIRAHRQSTPPADNVREALAVLLRANEHSRTSFAHNLLWHKATADAILAAFEVRPRGTVTDAEVSTPPADDVRECPSSDTTYEQGLFACRNCGEDAAAHEFRPRGTVTPTVDEWAEQMDAERARQIEHGYDDEHDVKHGAAHLLNWAIDYARRGNNFAAATMARCALRLPRGTVTDSDRVLANPNGGCSFGPFDQDAGGGYTEHLLDYEPDCPVHSRHLYDPRTGAWIVDPRGAVTDARGCSNSACPLTFAHDGPCAPEGWTPPADDVREALAEAWQLGFGAGFIDRHRAHPDENGDYGATLPLPNPYGEVRPRGTVTDAEGLAKSWDEGFTLATRNNPNQPHPLAQLNPYRGEARS